MKLSYGSIDFIIMDFVVLRPNLFIGSAGRVYQVWEATVILQERNRGLGELSCHGT